MKLEIENKTRWDGRGIRSLVLLGLRNHGIEGCKVVVSYQRKGARICGRAAVGGRWMALYMPRDGDPDIVARKLSSTIDHECLHLRGLMHRAFPKHARYVRPQGAPWHPGGCAMVLLPEPVSPTLDAKREAKLAHAQGMLAQATTRLKRATTIEKKWRRRVKELERRARVTPEGQIEEALKLVAGSSS